MRHIRFILVFACALLGISLMALRIDLVRAQTATPPPTPTPYPLPPPNALLIYDKTSATLLNTSSAPLALAGVAFMRAGGVYKFNATSLGNSLAPGHCAQVWTTDVRTLLPKPADCPTRDRWLRSGKPDEAFWGPTYDHVPFRPQFRGSALAICDSSAGRCAFNIPQGDAAKKPWAVLDPATGLPMPAGMQIAYDDNQLWIGNLTPNTVLPTGALRLFYTANGQGIVWTPSKDTWDGLGAWDNRPLNAGQCLVLYLDPSKVTPLLPCAPIGKAVHAEQPWRLKFDVMGPREERRAPCGSDKPAGGPVLCLVGG